MGSKGHPWISCLTCHLHRTANLPRGSPLPSQTFLVSEQNERLPLSALRTMQQERVAGRHILHIVLQSSFGTLTPSRKSLGYIHIRFGTRGTCSTCTSKSCARRGSNWAYIYTVNRASIPSPPLPRQCKPAFEASAVTTGYPHFLSKSSLPSRHPLSATPLPCNQSEVQPPTLLHRVFTHSTNLPRTPSQRQRPQSRLRNPTETRVRPSLPIFPSPARARQGPLSRVLRACLTYFLSARAGAGSRVPCGRKKLSRLAQMASRSSRPCLHPRNSV